MESHNDHRAAHPVRLVLPAAVERTIDVFARSAAPPFEPLILSWLERRASEPLRGQVGRWLEAGRLEIKSQAFQKLSLPFVGTCIWRSFDRQAMERVEAARHFIQLRAEVPLTDPPVALWSIIAAGRALAAAFRGAVFDEGRQTFWAVQCENDALPAAGDIAVAEHIQFLNSVDERGLMWFTTMGLRQFGLPNLEVRDAPANLRGRLAYLVGAVGQVLVESALAAAREVLVPPEIHVSPAEAGRAFRTGEKSEGKGGVVRIEWAPPAGRREPLLSLLPPRGFERNAGTWLSDVLEGLAPRKDDFLRLEGGDPDLEAAHRRAVSELRRVKKRFRRGLGIGSELLVKHGFAAECCGKEFMWVAVTTWKGSRIQGHLDNTPRLCADLRAGDPVELAETEVYDWLIKHKDGRKEGGYTDEVLERIP